MGFLNRRAEFYDFAREAQHYRYANGVRELTYQTQVYAPYVIKRTDLGETQDLSRNMLDLTVPLTLPILDLFRAPSPLEVIELTLFSLRDGDATADSLWIGEIGSVEFQARKAIIHCLPPMATLKGLGLRRNWQKQCPLVVYGAGLGQCNASKAAMRVDATITGVTGAQIQAAEFASKPDGWFAGGWMEWSTGEITGRAFIVQHVGQTCTVLVAPPLPVGTVVATYPGCDHTLNTCASKFISSNPADINGNSANYGGQPWIPEKNPLAGDSVY